MRNIAYHFSDSIAVHIMTLNGELLPSGKNAYAIFDDKDSFSIRIRSAEIAISAASLAAVLNKHVFASPTAPLQGLSVSIEKGQLKVKGKLHSKGDIPFETSGTLTPTTEGKIRLHSKKIKVAHLPVKGLLDFLGVKISDLIKNKKVSGVTAEGDDLLLDPQQILPPPHIQGRVTAIRLEGQNIVQNFGVSESPAVRYLPLANYMSYRGSQLGFGKLTMMDTDMVLIDMDPQDPFDFYLDHYKDQLVAGYTKIAPNFGLRVFMKDFNKLPRARPVHGRTHAK